MKWIKNGLIFKPLGKEHSHTHCQPPTPLQLSPSIYRIYFGSRNFENVTQVFWFDYDLEALKVLSYSEEPLLTKGQIGFFDQHGIYPSCVIKSKDYFYMYTLGFTQGIVPLYYLRIGLATGKNVDNFAKYSSAPIMNVSEHDPCIVTGPFVMFDNNFYRMWYVSGYKWEKNADGKLQSYYHIKYAESDDGIHWKRDGHISIDHIHSGETNISRPWIIKEDAIYKAWFSYSCDKKGYRIGYAESRDGGYTFERMDQLAGIHTSDEPWENEAVAYPAVIVYNKKKYMFYNGNKFGKDGIALAIEE